MSQTSRHSHIVFQLGIRDVVLAVNKMDLVDFSPKVFESIAADYRDFAKKLGLANVTIIPIVARDGDNVTALSQRMPWYQGPSLLSFLESVELRAASHASAFRFPIQWVNRPNGDFRGFSGTIASGTLSRGDEVLALPSGRVTRVSRVLAHGAECDQACAGDAITVVLGDEIDLSRGDMVVAPSDRPQVADQFAAQLIWMDDEKMFPHRSYQIRCGTQWATAEITSVKHKVSIETMESISGDTLDLNELAVCNISTNRPLIFDPYVQNRNTGSFVLVNRLTNQTAAAGMIMFGLRRATNVIWHATDVTKTERAKLMQQRPCCLWFTGLSGSGKSTITNLLERRFFAMGRHSYILDGDNMRHGLCRDLGFTDVDRVENIRRAAHAARLMVDAGLIVLTAFISPFKADRRMARELFDENEFIEVYVDTSLEICEGRDPKGLYKKARSGLIPNFTGISAPYEAPVDAEIHLECGRNAPEVIVEQVLQQLRRLEIL
jgi:bifunctional enzyme CysN/CysC